MSRNAYDVITDRVIELLEQGTIPWRKTWAGAEQAPQNIAGRPYRGVNVFLLACAGFSSPYWLTYRQAQELGGHVCKGQHGWPVVFWKWREADQDAAEETQSTARPRQVPLVRYYTVFNVAQCEVPADKLPVQTPQRHAFDPIERCEAVVAGMPRRPHIEHGHAGAFYRPASDTVHMPLREQFERSEYYYSTLFHELVHATGHANRLDRAGISQPARFGDAVYSREELVAEMGAAFLSGHAAIERETLDNSASYVAGWLAQLKSDKRLVVTAAAQAQKAADYILAHSPSQGGEGDSQHETL